MRKIYLLVQNDIRTGPFTIRELLQQPLHSESLIWVIGESEDWLSPLEIPRLQPYFKQNEAGQLSLVDDVFNTIDFKSEEMSTPAPVYPSSGFEKNDNPSTLENYISSVESEKNDTIEDSSLSFKATKKQNTQNFKSRTEEELEKEETVGLGKNKWPVLATISLLVLLIIWSILFNGNNRSKESLASTATHSSSTSLPIEKTTSTESVGENMEINEMPLVVPPEETPARTVSSVSTDDFLDSVSRVLDSQDQLMAAVDEVYKKSFRYPKRLPIKAKPRTRNSAITTVANKTKQTNHQSAIPVHQQIDLQSRYIRNGNKQNLSGLEVMVKNNSKKLLKSVSVDVFYYKKGEHLVDKETVYFSNVYPRQSLTMAIPGHQKAITARMQLGTVTLADRP